MTAGDGDRDDSPTASQSEPSAAAAPSSRERKAVLLRLDPAVHAALARWAADELRSVNGQIEFLLRQALSKADRMPSGVKPPRGRGRPRS